MNRINNDSLSWRRDLLGIALAGLLSLLPFLGQTDDLVSREVRHAQIAREMATHGHFLVPTLLGETYIDKPPVMHTLIALLYRLAGEHNMLLARLPSVLAAVGGALALYGIALTLYGRKTALIAGFGVLTLIGYTHMARAARPDMIYTFAILLACLGFTCTLRRAAWQAWPGLLLAGVAAGIATICKGPLGLLFPLMFVPAAIWRNPLLRRPAVMECVIFVAVFVVSLGMWLVPAWLQDGGDYVHRVLSQPDLDPDSSGSGHPFWWYLPQLLAGLVPMVFLLPWVVKDLRQQGVSGMLVLVLLMLLLLSCVSKKRIHYLLPVFPFLVMVIADAVVRFEKVQAAKIFVGVTLLCWPLYFAYQQSRSQQYEDWQFSVAREVAQKAGKQDPILCNGVVGEYVAFMAADDQVSRWADEAELRAALAKSGGSAWVIFSADTAEILQHITGVDVQASELLLHQKDAKKNSNPYYMRRVQLQ
ncbi:MAG TPA: glycosyltransferase family 39 protein [Pseudomonadales bacterium]|nr:glycosyltransferase family 39 protein [Pseudomonadales bacterium]